ncbi:unnamed protein product [Caenorhabditis nigoni]
MTTIFFTMKTQGYISPIRGETRSCFCDPNLGFRSKRLRTKPETRSQSNLRIPSAPALLLRLYAIREAEKMVPNDDGSRKGRRNHPGVQGFQEANLIREGWFDGELWSKAMLASEKEKNFAREMKKQYAIHANDNFFTQMDGTLNGTAEYKTRSTVNY